MTLIPPPPFDQTSLNKNNHTSLSCYNWLPWNSLCQTLPGAFWCLEGPAGAVRETGGGVYGATA